MLDSLTEELKATFLCITEHWQNREQLNLIKIRNYKKVAEYCRASAQHGGSAIYVRTSIPCSQFTELDELKEDFVFECSSCICRIQNFECVIVVIYRSPTSDVKLFLENFYTMLTILSKKKLIYFISGDFNINTLGKDEACSDFKDLLDDFGAILTIKEWTRITDTSKSCLDNIITNYNSKLEAKVIDTGISDHRGQVLTFSTLKTPMPREVLETRDFGRENVTDFCGRLKKESWSTIYKKRDINASFSEFLSVFMYHFNICFPKIKVNKRSAVNNRFFLNTPEIREIKEQLVLYQMVSNLDHRYKIVYKCFKDRYNKMLQDAKRVYYRNRICLAENKSKATWQVIKDITKTTSKTTPSGTNIKQTADNFNKYFVNASSQLLDNCPVDSSQFYNNFVEFNNMSMFLTPVTVEEILLIIKNMKNKKSTGIDEVPISVLKSCMYEIAYPLCYLINLSFELGIFPDELKLTLVKPLFKSGGVDIPSNYRPISLLTCFSKIFEYVMTSRLTSFFATCNLFAKNQHGYLKERSIDTALYDFIGEIFQGLETGELTCGIFLDLSKAFDCINFLLIIN